MNQPDNAKEFQSLITSYQEIMVFRPDRFNPVLIAQNKHTKLILACFEEGQFIPVHSPRIDLSLIILEGAGAVIAGSQENAVGPGSIIHVPAGQPRGIQAHSRLVALHMATPPPTEADHTEVMKGLQMGKWK